MSGAPSAAWRGRMRLDVSGWLAGVRRVPSPNCDERPAGESVTLVVVHAISLPPGQYGGDAVERLFTNTLDPREHTYFATIAGLRVSAHFLITRGGALTQFVACTRRAWHAGVSSWRGRERCNDFSIGVELEGCDDEPFTSGQYRVLALLLRAIRRCHPGVEIAGHSDVAPGRKTDPGPHFDWTLLRRLLER